MLPSAHSCHYTSASDPFAGACCGHARTYVRSHRASCSLEGGTYLREKGCTDIGRNTFPTKDLRVTLTRARGQGLSGWSGRKVLAEQPCCRIDVMRCHNT